MKVAHLAIVSPRQCGLYETARDMVAAERAIGMDARLVDPVTDKSGKDRGVPIEKQAWAQGADVWVSHSGPNKCVSNGHPIIHMLHGRPYSSFLLELDTDDHCVYTYVMKAVKAETTTAFVTLWPEHVPYWGVFVPEDKLHAAPAPVDLQAWQSEGLSGYDFHGHRRGTNVIISDMWREDSKPYHSIMAYAIFARNHPEARLHIYATPQKQGDKVDRFLTPLVARDQIGEVKGQIQGLENVYRAADMLITPHRIATRTVREALACGCQVVMGPGNDYTPYTADPVDIEAFAEAMERAWQARHDDPTARRYANRLSAEQHFDPEKTARVIERLAVEAKAQCQKSKPAPQT